MFRIEPSYGDGHCLIYSVVRSLNLQLSWVTSNEMIKDKIRAETINHIDYYKEFIVDSSALNIQLQMCAYIDAFNYSTSFADMLPLVFANMLSLDIVIIEKLDDSFQHFVISGRGSGSERFFIHL